MVWLCRSIAMTGTLTKTSFVVSTKINICRMWEIFISSTSFCSFALTKVDWDENKIDERSLIRGIRPNWVKIYFSTTIKIYTRTVINFYGQISEDIDEKFRPKRIKNCSKQVAPKFLRKKQEKKMSPKKQNKIRKVYWLSGETFGKSL